MASYDEWKTTGPAWNTLGSTCDTDAEDLDAFRDAARETLDALHALYIADFDADDSGATAHAIGGDA